MKLTIIQTELNWENRDKNIQHFEKLIDSIIDKTDLIILPEMFTTGFTMNPKKYAESADGETLKWLKFKSKEKQSVITGSIAVEEHGYFYNRLYWINPNGEVNTYDKRHLFSIGTENQFYKAGSKKIITHLKNWKFCPLICYDLRFPVWSRNRFQINNSKPNWDYDVLIYVANWPEKRIYAWKHLLIARAIENQCYVIGINRIGIDGNGIKHSGNSLVINPRGEIIFQLKENEEQLQNVILDWDFLEKFRKEFPVGIDADDFKI